ncbi:hypothetical protein ABBQ32_011412 [Trebouxia sp. C0010 RCD-2024]
MPAAGETAARRLSRGELVEIAQQEAVKDTYLATISKALVECVDAALLVNDRVLPVHTIFLISASTVLADLLSSQASEPQDHVQMVPLLGDGEDCVLDALAFIYRRMVLSEAAPRITTLSQAKHLVHFGHKYQIQVLLDRGDAFMCQLCKENLPDLNYLEAGYDTQDELYEDEDTIQNVQEYIALAEAHSLKLTLGVCETWFIQHFWHVGCFLGSEFTEALEKLQTDTLARITAGVHAEFKDKIG